MRADENTLWLWKAMITVLHPAHCMRQPLSNFRLPFQLTTSVTEQTTVDLRLRRGHCHEMGSWAGVLPHPRESQLQIL